MSMQSARDFLIRMRVDPALADKMASATTREERRSVALALGFDFAAEELADAEKELPVETLDRILGGHDVPSCIQAGAFTIG